MFSGESKENIGKKRFKIILGSFLKFNYGNLTVRTDSFSSKTINPFFHTVEKWPNILLKSCGVNTAKTFNVCLTIFQHYERKD